MLSYYLKHTQHCRILIRVDFGRRQIVHHPVYEHYNIYTSNGRRDYQRIYFRNMVVPKA